MAINNTTTKEYKNAKYEIHKCIYNIKIAKSKKKVNNDTIKRNLDKIAYYNSILEKYY